MAFPPSPKPPQQGAKTPNPLGVSESESDNPAINKTGKPNPLKAWAMKKIASMVTG
jgi:hypothetical protein